MIRDYARFARVIPGLLALHRRIGLVIPGLLALHRRIGLVIPGGRMTGAENPQRALLVAVYLLLVLLESELSRRPEKQNPPAILGVWVFCSVGMPGFEPGAPCPPDKYSNRAELHPVT